jgi:hypothetical protein
MGRRIWTDEKQKLLRKLAAEGVSRIDIAKALGFRVKQLESAAKIYRVRFTREDRKLGHARRRERAAAWGAPKYPSRYPHAFKVAVVSEILAGRVASHVYDKYGGVNPITVSKFWLTDPEVMAEATLKADDIRALDKREAEEARLEEEAKVWFAHDAEKARAREIEEHNAAIYPSMPEYWANIVRDYIRLETLKATGEVHGVSRERIRQVLVLCVRRYRIMLPKNLSLNYRGYQRVNNPAKRGRKPRALTNEEMLKAQNRGRYEYARGKGLPIPLGTTPDIPTDLGPLPDIQSTHRVGRLHPIGWRMKITDEERERRRQHMKSVALKQKAARERAKAREERAYDD